MTSNELLKHLGDTWYREQSADDAHDAIWGEPFEGYTVPISEIEKIVNNFDYTNPEGMVWKIRQLISGEK